MSAVNGLLAVALIMFAARAATGWRGPVTSDESLYLSEAVSIAHGHLTYSSGAPIVHRPPLFPATLAPVMQLTDNSLEVARVVPALYALAALVALFMLGRLLFGSMVAAVSVVLAASAAYPARMSSEFFVDTPSTAFLLAAAAALVYGTRARWSAEAWCAVGGLLLGMAFLLKETAAFWLPLPLVIAVFDASKRELLRPSCVARWLGAFALLAAPWLGWVLWQTGGVYKLSFHATAELAAGAVAVVGFGAIFVAAVRRVRPNVTAAAAGSFLLLAWSAFSLRILELRPEPASVDYLRTVPHWLLHVFGTSVEPSPLIGLAWLFVLYRALRGDSSARTLSLIAALCLPLLVFIANRGWEPREVMPVVYLSYLALAWALIDIGTRVAASWPERQRYVAGALLLASVAVVAAFVSGLNPSSSPDTGSAAILNWTGPEEQATSAMLDRVPSGSVVLSSRLYYSQLYVDHGGRFGISQLPTLGVQFGPGTNTVRAFAPVFR